MKEIVVKAIQLSGLLLLYKLGRITNAKAKETVATHFYKNRDITSFEQDALSFCEKILPHILNPVAMDRMQWHKDQGHQVIIVSAMFYQVLKPWCAKNNIELLATVLEVENGKITGKFSSPNCYGPEKANRILEAGLLKDKPYIYAYGDSAGDEALLALADKAFYRKFH